MRRPALPADELVAMSLARQDATAAQLEERTGLARPTVKRILGELQSGGLVRQVQTKGRKVYGLAP